MDAEGEEGRGNVRKLLSRVHAAMWSRKPAGV